MTQPLVFISYSHKDESEKKQLLDHLGVLQNAADLIEVWSDDRIGPGLNLEQAIEQALARARVAILLISAPFLATDFIVKQIPDMLKRREQESLTIFPVIAKPCAWKKVKWLA